MPLVPVTVPLYDPLPPPPAHSLEAALYVDATSLRQQRTPLPISASSPSLSRTRPPSLAHFCAPSRLATTPATTPAMTTAITLGTGLGAAAAAAAAGPPSGVATGSVPPPRPILGSQLRRLESRGELYAPPAPVWPALASATSPAEIRAAVASLLLVDVRAPDTTPGWGTTHGTAESADGAAASDGGGWGGGGGRPPSRGSRDGDLDDPEIAAEVAWDEPSGRGSSRPQSDLNSKPSTPSAFHAAKGAHYGASASQLSGGGGVNKAPTPKNKPHTPSGRTPSPSQLAASAAAAMAEESRMRAVASLEIMQERARSTDFPGRRVEASRARLRLETRIAAAAARRGR